MEIDHIFFFVRPDTTQAKFLDGLGLRETFRRQHVGQGTCNVCYCFDDMYIELLWIDDPVAARSAPIRRTRLYERSNWKTNGACPFGISWRKDGDRNTFQGMTWNYAPPYFPDDQSIPVSTDSDDLSQPFMFRSPDRTAPSEWPEDRQGQLQRAIGLGTSKRIVLRHPKAFSPSPALNEICGKTRLELEISTDNRWLMQFEFAQDNRSEPFLIELQG